MKVGDVIVGMFGNDSLSSLPPSLCLPPPAPTPLHREHTLTDGSFCAGTGRLDSVIVNHAPRLTSPPPTKASLSPCYWFSEKRGSLRKAHRFCCDNNWEDVKLPVRSEVSYQRCSHDASSAASLTHACLRCQRCDNGVSRRGSHHVSVLTAGPLHAGCVHLVVLSHELHTWGGKNPPKNPLWSIFRNSRLGAGVPDLSRHRSWRRGDFLRWRLCSWLNCCFLLHHR